MHKTWAITHASCIPRNPHTCEGTHMGMCEMYSHIIRNPHTNVQISDRWVHTQSRKLTAAPGLPANRLFFVTFQHPSKHSQLEPRHLLPCSSLVGHLCGPVLPQAVLSGWLEGSIHGDGGTVCPVLAKDGFSDRRQGAP